MEYIKKYWIEAIDTSFNEHGIQATKEQIEFIANDMQMASEMQSESFGWLNIPNPSEARISELNKKINDAERDSLEWQNAFRKNVAMRNKTEESCISISKDGDAEIRHR